MIDVLGALLLVNCLPKLNDALDKFILDCGLHFSADVFVTTVLQTQKLNYSMQDAGIYSKHTDVEYSRRVIHK